jgi:hypothetical protein
LVPRPGPSLLQHQRRIGGAPLNVNKMLPTEQLPLLQLGSGPATQSVSANVVVEHRSAISRIAHLVFIVSSSAKTNLVRRLAG